MREREREEESLAQLMYFRNKRGDKKRYILGKRGRRERNRGEQ